MAFVEQQLVMVVTDLVRFTRAVSGMNALQIAELLERVQAATVPLITNAGGRVVKFLGDGYYAIAPVDAAAAIVAAVGECVEAVDQIAEELDLDLELSANIHVSSIAVGEFSDGTFEAIGMGSIHTFRMGAGAGIRISEPVYRKLASADRGTWTKYQPPAVYTWSAS
jgi:adenylate cyclase